jgi:hypothetical protein
VAVFQSPGGSVLDILPEIHDVFPFAKAKNAA